MYTLPLFPLNTVLFPGMPIQLHIFEPRYRLMVHRCLDEKQPFGVVLIQKGLEAYGPLAEPVQVGCAARIAEMTPLEDGRMNLTALGDERFRVKQLSFDEPYLVGEVESFPLERPHSLGILRGMRELMPWVKSYLGLVSQLDTHEPLNLAEIDLPEDPQMLLYLAASLLQVPATEKQPLLEAPGAVDLLALLLRLYRRENAVMRQALGQKENDTQKLAWLN
jgi:uncharacterized protein